MYEKDERAGFLRRADAAAVWALDAGIALVLLVPTAAVIGHNRNLSAHGAVVATVVGTVLSVLPLLWRRRWPVQVLAITVLVGLLVPGPAVFSPPAFVALFTVASRRPWRTAGVGAGATVVAFVLHPIIWGYGLPLLGIVAAIALAALALVLGLYQSTRLAYFEQLRDRAGRLERERQLLAEQAASEERLRIARELHDVVAHNVSLMVVQAQALSATTESQRAQRTALAIAQLGREAMGEMHHTLDLMRPDEATGERSPQPSLANLDALLEQARAAGVSADLSIEGKPRELAAGIELSAYRIVQEALTNVIKHAGETRAEVHLHYGDDGLQLEIIDQGHGQRGLEISGSGHGLVGMRERVALFGGTLQTGAVDGGGYRVEATLPYGGPR